MSNFLILINNAPAMAYYHKKLGEELISQGNSVYYAYTDPTPALTYDIELNESNVFVFSDFFKKNNFQSALIPDKYKDINLWETYFSDYDRYIVNYKRLNKGYEYYEKLICNLVNFFDDIFNKINIDHFIYENISNSFAHVCFEVAKKNNIGFLGYCVSRLPNRFEIQTEVLNSVEQFKNAFEDFDSKNLSISLKMEIQDYLEKYKIDIPSYHSLAHPLSYKYSLYKKYFNAEKFKMINGAVKFLLNSNNSSRYSYQLGNPLTYFMKLFFKQIKRRFKVLFLGKSFDKPDLGDKFFIFPLQMKPESSTSVWAKHFVDEVTLIKNIAFNLPFGTKLYVKEHFVNLGNLPSNIYKSIKQIPNVKLIHPLENNRDLIKRCKGVIALTSTMGFETIFMNKPVITFGDVFYQAHPGCIKLNSFNNLFDILLFLANNTHKEIEAGIHERFLGAYYSMTYVGNINYISYPEYDAEKFTKPLTYAILNKINEKN